MAQLVFGKNQQIQFASDNEFYEAVGLLAKNDGSTSIHWEHNEEQGAWASEGRIHVYNNVASFPGYFGKAFTAGRGGILHRINCNDYVNYLMHNHGFVLGKTQNQASILATIPAKHVVDFNRGLAL